MAKRGGTPLSRGSTTDAAAQRGEDEDAREPSTRVVVESGRGDTAAVGRVTSPLSCGSGTRRGAAEDAGAGACGVGLGAGVAEAGAARGQHQCGAPRALGGISGAGTGQAALGTKATEAGAAEAARARAAEANSEAATEEADATQAKLLQRRGKKRPRTRGGKPGNQRLKKP